MRTILATLAKLTLTAAGGLLLWRAIDRWSDRAEMNRLLAIQPDVPPRFEPMMVANLPEPARRFFGFAITEGTPLRTVAKIEMGGRFSLGTKQKPDYMAMRATQVLAVPHGFIWAMAARNKYMRVSGSDSGQWTRFWIDEAIPVARLGGDVDHARSAFGRLVAESLFWTPAALLPGRTVSWEAAAPDVARVTVRHGNFVQTVEVTMDAAGRPLHVSFLRWSNANPAKVFHTQPFGGYLTKFQKFDGFYLPTHVEAGNMFGTEDYFPFYVADVTSIRFPMPT